MGFELNTEAFCLLTQIEVGIREFIISIIKANGITNWFTDFLGSIQRETLIDVTLRINEASKNNNNPEIEDQYIYKVNRAIKTIEQSFSTTSLCHPFYYLNWTDMENLIRNKSNIKLIDNQIGKLNREALVDSLKLLNNLRNDIAHSRFISERDYRIIQSAFIQISALIPNFKELSINQSKEDKLDNTFKTLMIYITLVEKKELLSTAEIDEILNFLTNCKNSFWLNSIKHEILEPIGLLIIEMSKYQKFREMPGGLLYIQQVRANNYKLLTTIKTLVQNGQI